MSEAKKTFHLELSDFEYYCYRDDSFEHPMVMVLRIHIEGRLNVECFRNSLKVGLDHHPLLRCLISQTGRQLHWVSALDTSPSFRCTRHETAYPPADCSLARLDLKHETGATFELRVSPDRSILVAHFHHACVDGVGAIRFLSDVFAEYGQHTATANEDRPVLSFPDPGLLPRRGHCPKPEERNKKTKKWSDWLRGPLKFMLRKNYCINPAGRKVDSLHSECQNILHTAALPRTTVRQLKTLASARQVSTNDLCMMVYLQQISQWTDADRNARGSDLFRVLMPVSMRTPELDSISASNVLSYVFQPFRRAECRDSETLLTAIHLRTTDIMQSNEAAVLLKLFAVVRRVPGLFQLSRWLQPSFATAVLANVGDLKRVFGSRFPLKKGRVAAGNVVIQRIDGIAPLRRNTNVAISFGGYAGELILNLRANPQALSENESILFLNQVVSRLTEIAELQSLTPSPWNRKLDSASRHTESSGARRHGQNAVRS